MFYKTPVNELVMTANYKKCTKLFCILWLKYFLFMLLIVVFYQICCHHIAIRHIKYNIFVMLTRLTASSAEQVPLAREDVHV